MILVKARLLRSRVEDKVFDGTSTRHYVFDCQKTDLDKSIIPCTFSTKNIDSSKILESILIDKEFHFIPMIMGRNSQYSLTGSVAFTLDDALILHPDFGALEELVFNA